MCLFNIYLRKKFLQMHAMPWHFKVNNFFFLGDKGKDETVNKMICFIDIKVSAIIIESSIIIYDKQGHS